MKGMKKDSNLQVEDLNPLFGKVKNNQEQMKDLNPRKKAPNHFDIKIVSDPKKDTRIQIPRTWDLNPFRRNFQM